MDVSIRYSPQAKARIDEYIRSIDNEAIALAAIVELRAAFQRLAADPGLGTAPTGPFESRPIYNVRLLAGDRPRLAQVSFRRGKPGQIDVLAFSCVPV